MSNAVKTFSLETIIRGKWIVVSRRWSAVERDSFLSKNVSRKDIRFV